MRSSMKPALYRDICLQKCISNHETKQAFKFQSDPSFNCFTFDVRKINCWLTTFYFLLSYCFLYLILHKFCNVLTCDILGIQYLFKTIICSSVKMTKSHNITLIICSYNFKFHFVLVTSLDWYICFKAPYYFYQLWMKFNDNSTLITK